jgi:hypothetical protein
MAWIEHTIFIGNSPVDVGSYCLDAKNRQTRVLLGQRGSRAIAHTLFLEVIHRFFW